MALSIYFMQLCGETLRDTLFALTNGKNPVLCKLDRSSELLLFPKISFPSQRLIHFFWSKSNIVLSFQKCQFNFAMIKLNKKRMIAFKVQVRFSSYPINKSVQHHSKALITLQFVSLI